MKAIISVVLIVLTTNVYAADGKHNLYVDYKTNESLYFSPSKTNLGYKPKTLTTADVNKLYKHSYTKKIFSYNDKIGNPYNCFYLNEGEILNGQFEDKKGWVANVRHMDGTMDTYTFTGNASLINTKEYGYAFCVRRD